MTLSDILCEATTIPFNALDEELPSAMVVFGTGKRGQRARQRLEKLGVCVPFFLDNDPIKQGTHVDSIPVLAPEHFKNITTDLPVLLCSWAQDKIISQLHRLGVSIVYIDGVTERIDPAVADSSAKQIGEVLNMLSDQVSRKTYCDALRLRFYGRHTRYTSDYNIYRHPKAMARPGDIIMDGGAAEGDTLLGFLEDCHGDCELHLFEPTPVSYGALCNNITKLANARATAANFALWSKSMPLRFVEEFGCSHSNRPSHSGLLEVQAISLDEYVGNTNLNRVDLIKLDVEGAELEALKGSRKTIQRFRPRLHVCIYHKPQDLWEIPLYIQNLDLGYHMFVGHHSCCVLDTVLYCVPEDSL